MDLRLNHIRLTLRNLTQEKALLLTDKAEQQRIHDEAQGRLDGINARIAAIAAELEKKD